MPAPCAKRLAQARSRRSARIRGARIAALAAIRDRVSRDRRIIRDAALREPCQSRKRAARASRNARARDRGAAETIEVARDGRASVIGCCALPLVPDFPILRAGSALECIRVRVSLATLRAAAETPEHIESLGELWMSSRSGIERSRSAAFRPQGF